MRSRNSLVAALACACGVSFPALAQHSDEDLAKQLSNPVSALISVPLQYNYDEEIGPNRDGSRHQLNIQPVAPFSISADWNVISRTILPLISQKDVAPGSGSKSGTGDITQSLFFSPKKPTAGGLIWGAGPVFLIPTASDEQLGTEKWGIGPTAVVLKQDGHLTYGALANHIWSFAGEDSRADISQTFLQPFLAYQAGTWTYTVNSEATYDWKGEEATVPLNFVVSKITKIGEQRVSFAGGVRYWADTTETSPHGWGLRFVVTLLFPK